MGGSGLYVKKITFFSDEKGTTASNGPGSEEIAFVVLVEEGPFFGRTRDQTSMETY